jgi:cell division septation protein DedD
MQKAKTQQKPAPVAAKSAPPKPERKVAERANASASPADGGSWRIQLGAFSKRSSAETLYKRLSGSAPVSGKQPFLVPAGGVTRLQVGPYTSRTAASAACSALASKGQACFPVAPK